MGEEGAVVVIFGLTTEQFIEINQFTALGALVLAKVYFRDLFHAWEDNLALGGARGKEVVWLQVFGDPDKSIRAS